jgi:hypothetical protein
VIAVIEESAQYSEVSTYVIDKLPKEWEDMTNEERSTWIISSGKYQQTESVFVDSGELIGIEIEEN